MTDGSLPFYRYVVRQKGKVEIGVLSCGMCYTRVMSDLSVINGVLGDHSREVAARSNGDASPNGEVPEDRACYGGLTIRKPQQCAST